MKMVNLLDYYKYKTFIFRIKIGKKILSGWLFNKKE